MKRIVTALALAACAISASAQTSIVLHGLSHHFTERANGKQWNQQNLGVALRYSVNDELSLQGGVYRNSEFRTSVYALADITPLHIGPVSVGGFLGAATGYEARTATPIAGAVVRVQIDRVALSARFAPRAGVGGSAVASVEVGYSF